MTDRPKNGRGDRELWRRYRPTPESAEPISGFDANLVAAWLDDTLTDQDWQALEARLAATPDRVELLRAAAALPPATAEAMPAQLTARLKALAPKGAPARNGARARRFPGFVRLAEWAAVAAVLVVVAVVGFNLGSATGQQRTLLAADTSTDSAANFQIALDSYVPTHSVSFLMEGGSQ